MKKFQTMNLFKVPPVAIDGIGHEGYEKNMRSQKFLTHFPKTSDYHVADKICCTDEEDWQYWRPVYTNMVIENKIDEKSSYLFRFDDRDGLVVVSIYMVHTSMKVHIPLGLHFAYTYDADRKNELLSNSTMQWLNMNISSENGYMKDSRFKLQTVKTGKSDGSTELVFFVSPWFTKSITGDMDTFDPTKDIKYTHDMIGNNDLLYQATQALLFLEMLHAKGISHTTHKANSNDLITLKKKFKLINRNKEELIFKVLNLNAKKGTKNRTLNTLKAPTITRFKAGESWIMGNMATYSESAPMFGFYVGKVWRPAHVRNKDSKRKIHKIYSK